jgi:hypothetical protein
LFQTPLITPEAGKLKKSNKAVHTLLFPRVDLHIYIYIYIYKTFFRLLNEISIRFIAPFVTVTGVAYRSYSDKTKEGKNVRVQPESNIFKSITYLFNCCYTYHALHPNFKRANLVLNVTYVVCPKSIQPINI